MIQHIDERTNQIKEALLNDLLAFIKTFYKLLNAREFVISEPIGRESHQITICRALTDVFYLRDSRMIINVPPGYGKSTILSYFVAWCFAHYPDCQFIYISYSQPLAAKHTAIIKQIMSLPYYRKLFGVEISKDSAAKDNFRTTRGGAVKAFGSSGPITGQDAGLPGVERFSGGVIMDDMHKPMEVHSDTIREGVIENYKQTIKPRPRSNLVPMIFIGQRLHEGDLPAYLLNGEDGYNWRRVILKALDEAGNALNPMVMSKERLLIEQETNPYVFASQHQQDPQPLGGGIFKENWFHLTDEEPDILATFLTVDTAETDKNYNDATVFSFWGIYKVKHGSAETDLYALHWIDCLEIRVEPKDLHAEFMQFYADCMHHEVKPQIVAIEKKSTGATLLSVLGALQGLTVIDIDRTKASGNKTARFFEAQPYVAKKLVSLHRYAKHTKMCLEHCRKITSNNTHRHDDIADTMYDAIKIGLIDKVISFSIGNNAYQDEVLQSFSDAFSRQNELLKRARYG